MDIKFEIKTQNQTVEVLKLAKIKLEEFRLTLSK